MSPQVDPEFNPSNKMLYLFIFYRNELIYTSGNILISRIKVKYTLAPGAHSL